MFIGMSDGGANQRKVAKYEKLADEFSRHMTCAVCPTRWAAEGLEAILLAIPGICPSEPPEKLHNGPQDSYVIFR